MARNYGVEVTGITISQEQLELARQRCAGLPVTLHLMDYRDLDEPFERIVSVGMFEHVGPKTTPPTSIRSNAAYALKDVFCCTPSAVISPITVSILD